MFVNKMHSAFLGGRTFSLAVFDEASVLQMWLVK